MQNTQVILRERPEGMVSESNFGIQQESIGEVEEGQVLIEIAYISLDPAMRGWMNAGTTYIKGVEIGAVMRAFAIGKVISSKHPQYPVGTWVEGLLGAQSFAISDGKGLRKVPADQGELSWHLGIMGMPGMTAYFGLLERGKPEAGETVFISGAAGIVGSTVGQIAKIKGCRVVGTAGTDQKCRYLIEECGFDAAINYKTEDVQAALKQHAPDGIHVFYDNVGGPLLDTAMGHLARGARVVICGAISQYNASEMYGPKNYMKIVTARGYITGIIVFDFLQRYPEAIAQIHQWMEEGKMKTKEHIFEGIEQFPAVLKKLYTGENFGKLLIKV
ncbi:MAG: NADP-dependent oxidoreductase [Cyanothece sp. SIO1E1]|nr:NADP-dependent oxidoreductase [Cyanothece sp. SIO1E1]